MNKDIMKERNLIHFSRERHEKGLRIVRRDRLPVLGLFYDDPPISDLPVLQVFRREDGTVGRCYNNLEGRADHDEQADLFVETESIELWFGIKLNKITEDEDFGYATYSWARLSEKLIPDDYIKYKILIDVATLEQI